MCEIEDSSACTAVVASKMLQEFKTIATHSYSSTVIEALRRAGSRLLKSY